LVFEVLTIKPTRCINFSNLFWNETLHVSFQNKFEKLVYLVGFIVRKFVTMHGHMNVKFEVLSMMSVKTAVFCNVTPYSVVAVSQLSVESCYSRDQCRMLVVRKMESAGWSELLVARLQNVHLGT
jgi:hypothetical protein